MCNALWKLAGLGLILHPSSLWPAEKAASIVIVADSRNLSGAAAWWVNVYNDSHWHFALLTILVIPLAGALLGGAADFLMCRIGIDLKSRTLSEN